MGRAFEKGSKVVWDRGGGTDSGTISEIHTAQVTNTLKGTKATRDADERCPANTIKQSDGDMVLKSHSEIRRSS